MSSLILYLFIASILCVLQSGKAAASKEEVIKMTGDNITLNCNSSGSTPIWTYPEHLINNTRIEISWRFTEMTGKSICISTLTVQSADIDDTGVYSCLTSTARRRSERSGNTRELVKQYNVFVSDNRTLITTAPDMIQVTEGDDLYLPCRATMKDVHVLLGRIPPGRYDYSRVGYDAAHGYIVRNVGLSDEGHWQCTAQYGKLKTDRLIYVHVIENIRKGKAAASKDEVIKMTGDNITLNCNSSGSTPIWTYPEHLINNTRIEISSRFTQMTGKSICISTLTVQSADIDDTGVYSCLTSTAGRRSEGSGNTRELVKQYNVFVSDNRTLITTAPDMIPVTEGDDLYLPCRATMQDVHVLLERSPSGRYDYSRVDYDAAHGYIVRNVGLSDEGHWRCTAQYGKLKTDRLIYVHVTQNIRKVLKPKPQQPKMTSNNQRSMPQSQGNAVEKTSLRAIPANRVLAGDAMILRCEVECKETTRPLIVWNSTNVDGFQLFSVKNDLWKRGGDAKQRRPFIEPRKGYMISWSEREIPHIRMSDAGTYYCSVKSQSLSKSLATEIDVVERPFINVQSSGLHKNGSNFFAQAIRGLPTTFEFKVKAFPPPVFSIHRDGRGLDTKWMQRHTMELESSDCVIFQIKFNEPNFQDEGEYSLIIKSQKRKTRLIRKSVRFTMKVGDPTPPVIEGDDFWNKEKKTAIIGEALKLSCSVNGIPYPSIKWYKDDILAGNTSSLVILKVSEKHSGNYTCTATNTVGQVSRSVIVTTRQAPQNFKMGFSIAVPIFGLFFIAIGFALYLKTRKMREIKQQMKIHMQYLAPILDIAGGESGESDGEEPYDSKKWEIPRDRLKLGKTIGRGAFGRVVQATAYDIDQASSCKTVAVKMLKAGCRNSEFQALMSELKILIHMGPHLNIVNLYGACTTTEGPLMIVVEYCRFGNMSNYLRKHRSTYITRTRKRRIVSKEYDNDTKQKDLGRSSTDEGEIAEVFASEESALVDCCEENRCHAKWNNVGKRTSETSSLSSTSNSVSRDDDEACKTRTRLSYSCSVTSKESIKKASRKGYEEDKELTESDLLSYSYQVARGMEFLASRKCIHRDLAARNVLVADNDVVKICDFGLARDVYRDPDYVRNGEARLPLKWMALESIFDKVYSTKSDAWSFGILLWEIFSLGASPYPGSVMNEDFFNELKRGVRMQKPTNAPDRVYDSMLACWSENPDDRPTFTKLAEEFSDILQGECGSDYLDMLRIFEQNAEAWKDRKIAPVRRPEETFHQNNFNVPSTQIEPAENGDIAKNAPIIVNNMDSVQPFTSDDGTSLERSEYGSASNSQRPSIDVGINSSANETPPPYNALMAV